jgi:cytochrome P450
MKIDLTAPSAFFAGHPLDQYRWLQENDPVHWHPDPFGDPGFWAITKHADIKAIENNPVVFSSYPTVVLNDAYVLGDDNHHNMMFIDPPWHTDHRRFLSPELTAKSVRTFAPVVERTVNDVIDEVIERGECDIVPDVGGKLASYVTADLMGLPRQQVVDLYAATDRVHSARTLSEGDGLAALMEIDASAQGVFEDRRAQPRDDLVSRVAHGEYGGCPMDAAQFSLDFLLLVNAGGDTTRNAVGGGVLALFEYPDQRAVLDNDPSLMPSAVDEMLRWVTPLVYQRRSVMKNTEIRGRQLKTGQKLAMYYGAANRDPEVFPDPDGFDVRRTPNPQLAFGFGPHFCLGSHLAKQELVIMFRQILARMPDLAPNGPAVWEHDDHHLAPGLSTPKSVPVKFTPGQRLTPR